MRVCEEHAWNVVVVFEGKPYCPVCRDLESQDKQIFELTEERDEAWAEIEELKLSAEPKTSQTSNGKE